MIIVTSHHKIDFENSFVTVVVKRGCLILSCDVQRSICKILNEKNVNTNGFCLKWSLYLGDVMVIVVASSAVDRMVESRCQDKLFAVSPLGTQH